MSVSNRRPKLTRRAFIQSTAAAAVVAAYGNPAKLAASPGDGSVGLSSATLASASRSHQVVYKIPHSIPSDGSREVSRDINDWIASIPNGTAGAYNTAAFATNGIYWVDDTIEPLSKSYIAFAGNGSTFVRRNQLPGTANVTRARAHWRFNQCAWFSYDNLHVEGQADPIVGYNSALEAQHAFTHSSSVQSLSNNCSAKDVWGDAFNFARSSSGLPSVHHQIQAFKSGTVHRQGVSVTTGDDITFSNCQFGFCWRTAVDLEPNSAAGFATNILFEDCSWQDHHLNWVSAAAAAGVVENVTFRRCESPSNLPVKIGQPWLAYAGHGRRANFTFENCSGLLGFGNPSGALMQFHYVDGFVVVTNNSNPLQAGRTPPMRFARFDDYTTANAVVTYEGNTRDLG